MKQVVTIRDVAKHAGVSVGTVSRVLSDNPAVTAKLKQEVHKAIEVLGYRPNVMARSLRRHRTNMIALVVPDITNPYFSGLARHIEAIAHQAGHMVVLLDTHGEVAREEQQIAGLSAYLPAGFIIATARTPSSGQGTGNIRTLAIDRPYGEHPLIATDHYAGGILAARHLIGLGHRRMAYIAGPSHLSISADRRRGFLDQCAIAVQNGIDLPEPEVVEADFDFSSGEALVPHFFMRSQANIPTAIATASDQQAIGLIRGASDYGVSVPRDVSVIGFDGIPLTNLTTPRLSTIAQPLQQIAEAAVNAILANKPLTANIILPPILEKRESTIAI